MLGFFRGELGIQALLQYTGVCSRDGENEIHSVKPGDFMSLKAKERETRKKAFLRNPPGERTFG